MYFDMKNYISGKLTLPFGIFKIPERENGMLRVGLEGKNRNIEKGVLNKIGMKNEMRVQS